MSEAPAWSEEEWQAAVAGFGPYLLARLRVAANGRELARRVVTATPPERQGLTKRGDPLPPQLRLEPVDPGSVTYYSGGTQVGQQVRRIPGACAAAQQREHASPDRRVRNSDLMPDCHRHVELAEDPQDLVGPLRQAALYYRDLLGRYAARDRCRNVCGH